ncbi:hypothetical protein [Streptomyces sp. NPDC052179]|uniref:DUF7848 domain-containing protein n=1 Tax=Streptomyces sp. NPDC052179 TaxID=3155680 RepID=UPI003423C4F5
MRGERQVPAVRVRRGDLVCVWGQWQEVVANRLERYATGGMAVVLVFLASYPLRVPAASTVLVAAEAEAESVAQPKSALYKTGWVVCADASGPPAAFAAECTLCGESCEPTPSMSAQPEWCVDHAARTGHTGFRRIVTDLVRVSAHHEERAVRHEGV